jgi:type I restriction enzyme S subunit
MFGDPVKNEKGWEVKSIREFGKISTGNTPSRAESKNYNSNYIEWIKTDNIEVYI